VWRPAFVGRQSRRRRRPCWHRTREPERLEQLDAAHHGHDHVQVLADVTFSRFVLHQPSTQEERHEIFVSIQAYYRHPGGRRQLVPFSAQPRAGAVAHRRHAVATEPRSWRLRSARSPSTSSSGLVHRVCATDDAFAKLPAGTVEDLLKPENKAKLTAILTYHVVAGKVMAADVVKLKNAATVNGKSVQIKVDGGTVMVDNAKVLKTDIGTSNGVIHVIDTVLLPK
jgi:hypothetical protein